MIRKRLGLFRKRWKEEFGGGQRHGACASGERVRPIRFHQGIGAVDCETGLPQASDSRAGASSRGAHPDHRLPDHDLSRRVRPGARSKPAKARGDQARPDGAGRCPDRAHRPPRFRAARASRRHRTFAEPLARSHSGLGCRRWAARHRRRRRPSHPRPRPDRGQPRRGRPDSRRDLHGAALGRAGPAGRRCRHDAAERQRRAGGFAHCQRRFPGRSSSSRRRSIRCGARTRRSR